jgi:hypothetical protein
MALLFARATMSVIMGALPLVAQSGHLVTGMLLKLKLRKSWCCFG